MLGLDPHGFIGQRIEDRFVVGQLIHARDNCPLYEALDLATGKPVSLQMFLGPPNAEDEDRRVLLRHFVGAASTLARVSRCNEAVVHVSHETHYAVRAGNQAVPVAVLESLVGGSLARHLAAHYAKGGLAIGLDDTLALLDRPLQVVAAAHEHGIVHRQLAPANLWVFGERLRPGVPIKLMGHGGAPPASWFPTTAEPEVALHHAQYAAPEQFDHDDAAVGPWTDVYAMAIILLEVMRGGRPVVDGRASLDAARQTMHSLRRPTPRELGIATTDAVERVFAAAVTVDRRHRFRSVRDFYQALLEARDGRSAQWTKRAFSASAAASGGFQATSPREVAPPGPATVSYHGPGAAAVLQRIRRETSRTATVRRMAPPLRRAS
ncbi:MAG: hypothetical protein B7733_17575 [Myxococcales bacterium FL481]|nr:MAG: hypothetical protein B7733_17575 [Myxococcales bacterium FL481]